MIQEQQMSLFETKLSPEYLVTQSNSLIETPQDLNLQEKRIILTLASLVQPEDDHFKIHRIKVKDLADILGIEEKNYYKKVEEVVKKLQEKSITIQTQKSTLHAQWLSSSEYFHGKGYVELEFSQKLTPYLLKLKENYTPFKLRNVLRLRSEYSIRIYELLKQYEKLKKRAFTLEGIRYYLNCENKYKLYGHLKDKVIKKCQEELAEKTDLTFTFEERKIGNKVVGLIFYIQSNTKIVQEIIEKESLSGKDSYSSLIRMGLRPDTARKMVKLYSEERIKENLHYILNTKKTEDIDNISGYIYSAIKDDYAGVDEVHENNDDQDSIPDELINVTSVETINDYIEKVVEFAEIEVKERKLQEHQIKGRITELLQPYLSKIHQERENVNYPPIQLNKIKLPLARKIYEQISNPDLPF